MSDTAAVEPARSPRPAWAPLLLVGFAALVVCTNIANVVWARWIDQDPEAVMALSSRNRYLVLAIGSGISPAAYVAIAAVRLGVAFAVCHMLGRAYRDDAYRWFIKYLGMNTESIRSLEQGFSKAQWVLVPFFVGSNIVAVITGVERTPPARLIALFGVGLAGRLALIWWLANVFEEPLTDFLEFVARYQWWVIIGSIVLVVAVNARNMRRGSGA
ncbi:MAG: hypothetical protein M3337_01750 [Actinomycetota bacterium]|nr:hypothetical protein [Actinomycetota bacterium]